MLQSIGGTIEYPYHTDLGLAASGINFTFSGATNAMACIFHIPKTGTIANVHYRVSTSTSPSLTLRIELRTVDTTTGLPNAAGTLYGSSTSITVANPTTGFKSAAVNCTGATAGDLVALVFDLSAFTSGSIALVERIGGSAGSYAFPYVVQTGTIATSNFNNFSLEYTGGLYFPGEANFANTSGSTSSTVTNSGTTRRGNIIGPMPFTARCVGILANLDADGDCLLRLRDLNDNILATATIDKDVRGTTSGGAFRCFFDSFTTVTISHGVSYYILVEGNSATATTIWSMTVETAAQLDAVSGTSACSGVSFAGSYSTTIAQRYGIALLLDQFSDGSSAFARGNAG